MATETKAKETEAIVEEAQKIAEKPVIFDFSSEPKEPKRRTRKTPVTKGDLEAAFGMLTLGAWALNRPDFVLDEDEIESLASAWYEVIKEYPEVGHLLIQGRKVTVWGKALLVTYTIVAKRAFKPRPIPAKPVPVPDSENDVSDSPGTTRTDGWENRLWEDNPSEAPSVSA